MLQNMIMFKIFISLKKKTKVTLDAIKFQKLSKFYPLQNDFLFYMTTTLRCDKFYCKYLIPCNLSSVILTAHYNKMT